MPFNTKYHCHLRLSDCSHLADTWCHTFKDSIMDAYDKHHLPMAPTTQLVYGSPEWDSAMTIEMIWS